MLERGQLGTFMPGSFEDPLGGLVSEFVTSISPENKLVATELSEQRIAALYEEKARSGAYTL
ncbi:MAG: hypothetical protein ACREL3_00840 [Gemmatimonadales bacterium]